MANVKISELTTGSALGGTEYVLIVQNGVTVKTTAQAIANLGGAPEPYIYNVGNSGINTGYIHNADTKIKLKATLDYRDNYAQIWGTRAGGYATNSMGFFAGFQGSRICYYRTGQEVRGDEYTASSSSTTTPIFMIPIIIEASGQTCSWYKEEDPTNVHSVTAQNANVNGGIAPIGIFCGNNANAANGWSPVDYSFMFLYWFEIYENDTLLHRFVPAYNNNQYCLYDEIEDEYIYDVVNSGQNLRGFIPTT